MTNLSYWDFVDEFSAKEAASLILGVDPAIDNLDIRTRPIVEKLRLSYQSAWGYWHSRFVGDFVFNEKFKIHEDAIQSVAMAGYAIMFRHRALKNMTDEYFSRWFDSESSDDGELSGFFVQRFSRMELSRWLFAVGMRSAYSFALDANRRASRTDSETVGTKERSTLLCIIAALCKEAKLDYTAHSKTAGFIQSTADVMGIAIGDTTIEGHLKKIPDALERRMK